MPFSTRCQIPCCWSRPTATSSRPTWPRNESKVGLGTPRIGGDRQVDLHVAPLTERPGHIVVMLQERTIADKMDRQLTHRSAARSVIALAAMLAHEIKNP